MLCFQDGENKSLESQSRKVLSVEVMSWYKVNFSMLYKDEGGRCQENCITKVSPRAMAVIFNDAMTSLSSWIIIRCISNKS